MTVTYFASLPQITYDGKTTIDITRRVALLRSVVGDPHVLRPFDVPSGMRADQIADGYYSTSEREWLVWLSQGVMDPYYDWYLSYPDFISYLESQYGSVSEAQERIHHWAMNWYDDDSSLSIPGFTALPYNLKKYYEPLFTESGKILSYVRREEDVWATTNMIVTIQSNNAIQPGERAQVWNGSLLAGDVETTWANSSTLVLINVVSDLQTGYNILGLTSGSNSVIQSVTYTSNTIPIDERPYWEPVSFYDWENDKNESRKSVNLVDSSYAQAVETQMIKLFSS